MNDNLKPCPILRLAVECHKVKHAFYENEEYPFTKQTLRQLLHRAATFIDSAGFELVRLSKELRASPWIPVNEFKDIPEGKWLVEFNVSNLNPAEPPQLQYAVCWIRGNYATIGDCFASDRLNHYSATRYMEIPE